MEKTLGKLLIVDDDPDVVTAARLFLKQHAVAVHTENSPENIPGVLSNGDYDLILLDMNFERDATSGAEGLHWLRRILQINPSIVVVLATAYGDVELAVRGIKAGAFDFIPKPWQNEKLLATLSAAMRLRQLPARGRPPQTPTEGTSDRARPPLSRPDRGLIRHAASL